MTGKDRSIVLMHFDMKLRTLIENPNENTAIAFWSLLGLIHDLDFDIDARYRYIDNDLYLEVIEKQGQKETLYKLKDNVKIRPGVNPLHA